MDATAESGSTLTPLVVKDQLDEILTREITALLDVDSDVAMMSFNLVSISCITLIIEREREIKQGTNFPQKRYTIQSLINELVEIGLEKDDALEKTVASVLNKGYISMDENKELKAEKPSIMMVEFLDNMFPGMQGMNLIAFVLQMNSEVNSGRKTLELAKKSFQASLKSRGVAVSKKKARKKATENVSGRPADKAHSGKAKLKKDNLDRLSKIIKQRRKKSFDSSGTLKIKDVFDKGSSKIKSDHQTADLEKAKQAEQRSIELNRVLAEKEEKIKAAETAAIEASAKLKEIEQREQQALAARKAADEAEQRAALLLEREARMLEKESRLKALEEKLEQQEKLKQEEKKKKQIEEQTRLKQEKEAKIRCATPADEDIESRIAAFENELAMPCPLCKEGEVTSKTTEKGKEYFLCTRPDCRFVSWDKPYHFECPLCRNPFLTQLLLPNGEKGLKCPRASCSYTQKNLYDPKQNMAEIRRAPKKKRRVVRRKRR